MKTLKIILLTLITTPAFAQSVVDWKTQKNHVFSTIGICSEGHDVNFSKQLFKNKNQYISVEGGAGIFSPTDDAANILSSGFTFNRGKKNHFFSIGIHTTYASKDALTINSFAKEAAYLSNAQIGYCYTSNALAFQLHVQPLNGISNRISNLGSTASLSFHF